MSPTYYLYLESPFLFEISAPKLIQNTAHGIIIISKPSTLTAHHSGSSTKSFTISSLIYGRASHRDQGVIMAALLCIITVDGYKTGSSAPYCTRSFMYSHSRLSTSWTIPMTCRKFFARYQGLQNITFALDPSLLSALFDR